MIKWEQSKEEKNEKEEECIESCCLMAQKDEIYREHSSKFIFNELYEVFNELMDEYKKIRLQNKELKKINLSLVEEKNKILE